jgi:hypothetical protein
MFNIIPSDLLLLIINNLDTNHIITLSKVNKYFNIFIKDNKNYIILNSDISICDINDNNIDNLINRFPNIKYKYYPKINKNYNDIIKYKNNIYELNFELCFIDDKIFNDISNNLKINNISIINLSYNTTITDLSCFKNNKTIKKLILNHCLSITDFSFLETCENINYLDLTNTSISSLLVLKNNKSINYLKLSYCRNLIITDYDIMILSSCKNIMPLKSIDLSDCNNINLSIISLFENINNINLFSYKGPMDLSFLDKCNNINHLNLSNTNLTNTDKIKNINYIDLSYTNITCITDVGKISYLNLSNCNFLNDISNLKNSNISYLDLSSCNKINDISMLSHIGIIYIRRCPFINIKGLNNIIL